MKRLNDILYRVPIEHVIGNLQIEIPDFHFDSRLVSEGCMFIALKGTLSDGHDFINQAIQKGAKVIVCQDIPDEKLENICYIQVKDSMLSLGLIAANFYGNPSEELKVIGVTGTNGKTSTATLLFDLFRNLGYRCGLISTIQICVEDVIFPTNFTTPDAKTIQEILKKMLDMDCEFCFMEVSSHAIDQNRIAGIEFMGGIFTNITHDHLDYHGTFANYLKAKQTFFDKLPRNAFALTNIDDKNGKIIVQNTKAKVLTYSLKSLSNCKGKILENTLGAMLLEIDNKEVWVQFTGVFNAYNLMGIYGCAVALGEDSERVLVALSKLQPVKGRFQVFKFEEITAIIDYAHSPDALKNVLETIWEVKKEGKIITVFGCGGNRDKEKRPVMGKIAADLSDIVLLTSDNPRNEPAQTILDEIEHGISISLKTKVLKIENREQAIHAASKIAQPGDIILIAGKGHENYQEINGTKLPFDDQKVLFQAFNIEN